MVKSSQCPSDIYTLQQLRCIFSYLLSSASTIFSCRDRATHLSRNRAPSFNDARHYIQNRVFLSVSNCRFKPYNHIQVDCLTDHIFGMAYRRCLWKEFSLYVTVLSFTPSTDNSYRSDSCIVFSAFISWIIEP